MTGQTRPTINSKRLFKLLKDMVEIYSPSGKEEEIIEFLENYLRRFDIPVIRQRVDEDRENLLFIPKNEEIELALIGHVDTVPAYDWNNYGFEQDGDEILGLGTADMKGGCAAMVEAMVTLFEHGLHDLPIALLFLVGEEENGDGCRTLLDEYHFPWAIIGEPTDLIPCLNHYSYMEMKIESSGRRMHASMANQGHNAIQSLLTVLKDLTRFLDRRYKNVVYNIRDMNSPRAGFAVPDHCEAWLDLHLPPDLLTSKLAVELEDIVANPKHQNKSSQSISVTFTTIHGGYQLSERGLVPETLLQIYQEKNIPWKTGAFRSHSDANLLWAAGIKPILLGPGLLEKAHTQDEAVPFHQVCSIAQIYLEMALRIPRPSSPDA
jgi:acetylornithine deacetylase